MIKKYIESKYPDVIFHIHEGVFYILEPRRGYHGLIIFNKENEIIDSFLWLGYQACICIGFDEAKKVINEYLKL